MKQIFLSLFLYGIANCGTLDNSYLPPQNSQSSAGSQVFEPPIVIDARSIIQSGQPIKFNSNGQKSAPSEMYYLAPTDQYSAVGRRMKVFRANDVIPGPTSQQNDVWYLPIQGRHQQQYYPSQVSLSRYPYQYSGEARFAQDFGLPTQYQENFDISSSSQYGVPYGLQNLRKQHGGSINIANAVIPQRKFRGSWQAPYEAPNMWNVRNDDGGYKY